MPSIPEVSFDLSLPQEGTGHGPYPPTNDDNGSGGSSGMPSRFEMALMSPRELAEFFGQDVDFFDIDIFMKRFGKFIEPFDDTKINLLEEGFQIGAGMLSNATTRGLGRIQSNMSQSAGAERERAFVMADYAGRMGQLGLDLETDIFEEYESFGERRSDFFQDLASKEIFSGQYWGNIKGEQMIREWKEEHGYD
jgi:hypothetical protein